MGQMISQMVPTTRQFAERPLSLCMRITILKTPEGPEGTIDGVRVDHLQVGRTYDFTTSVASTLIVDGYARVEMRSDSRRERASDQSRTDPDPES